MENLAWAPMDAVINMAMLCILYVPSFIVLGLGAIFWRPQSWPGFGRRFFTIFTFYFTLLLTGAFYSFWGNVIWGWLYRSTDYCGCDFFPVIPIGRGAIDDTFGNEPHGLYHGMTLFDLQLVWFAFAAATWITTVALHRLLTRDSLATTGVTPNSTRTPLPAA